MEKNKIFRLNYYLDIFPKLSASIMIFIFANLIRVILTIPNQTWYAALNKPFFVLPGKLFEPIWLVIFLITGIAFYIVWEKGFDKKEIKIALFAIIFAIIINFIGTGIFFGLEMPLIAFFISLLLIFVSFLALKKAIKVSKTAGLLLVPYILWIAYITFVELGIFLLNG